jgi:hypothetical protein
MFYIGHFSFRESGEENRHGYFTVVMEGDGIEKTLSAITDLLQKLQEEEQLFHEPCAIYLDSATYIKTIPKEGLMAHMIRRKGGLGPSVSISLPGVSQKVAEHFGMVSEPSNSSGRDIGEGFAVAPEIPESSETDIEPFLEFG